MESAESGVGLEVGGGEEGVFEGLVVEKRVGGRIEIIVRLIGWEGGI